MEDPRWLRLITIGLVLAALVVGYFLLTGKLASNSVTKTASQVAPSPSVLGQNVTTTPNPDSKQAPKSAYETIASRTQSQVQTLPKTGFPVELAVAFSASAVTIGWSLRRYPK